MEPKFVHLRLHTEFSLSDGLTTVSGLMEKCTADHMPAVAITDKGNLYAAVKFFQAALAAGIKPIIGVDVLVSEGKENFALTLLCQNNKGYRNLTRLISLSFIEGQSSGFPVIKKEWLEECSDGLIALSGAQLGEIGHALIHKNIAQAQAAILYFNNLFPQRFYIEVARVGKKNEADYIYAAVEFAHTHQIPIVATNDARFLETDDYEAHEARVCIQDGVILADPNRKRLYTAQQYFRTQKEMAVLFADLPEALLNTIEISKRCNVTFTLGKSSLPHYDVPESFTTESYLCDVAKQGLDKRLATILDSSSELYPTLRRPYDQRLERELNVINEMGFAGYFLIVADFISWAKNNGIPVGPGRGSGPGSLVAYSLDITDLDPLQFELLFERFLNPERVSMPDFDIDFCMEGRDRVIEYVMQRHGKESVSHIITYGTMAAKAVIRDVGRVLALGYNFVDKIAKLIPFELGITLQKALDQEPLLLERYEQEEEVKTLIDLALKLEGLTRNVGKHAGGIVIAPGKLTDFVPLYCEPTDQSHPVTQFDKDDVEAVGLVKFDFLGLKTLTIIDRALKTINKELRNENEPIVDITRIPLNDVDTFKMLKACQSTAVFQLESHGMRDLIKRLQPDCFEDLIALVALFRPGPLQSGMVDDFINRKHGRAKVMYPHPKLEPILSPTYGVILYQEQVMQIARDLAGYTLGAADILRRAMGKKKPEEMAKQRKIFCDGADTNGIHHEIANHIFDNMEKFAGYGFNKSHSAAYALIAYQTAWLKARYSAAFMAAVLTSEIDRTEKVIILKEECRNMGIQLSPPDINQSEYFFKVLASKHILYGLGALKGVGEAAIENIISVRHSDGPFTCLFDFCQRIDLKKSNKRVLEALIKSGSMDCFGENRATLLASLSDALQQAEQSLHNQTFGQHDLLGLQISNSSYNKVPAWEAETQLKGEKETLGYYLSGHPLDRYRNELKHFTTCNITDLHPHKYKHAKAAGIISNIRTRQTKRGDRIAICTLEDGTAQIEVVCFSECFQKYRALIVADQLVVVEGELSLDDFSESARIVAKDIYTIDEARERHAKHLRISIKKSDNINISQLETLFKSHLGGDCGIIIRYVDDDFHADIRLGQQWNIKPKEALLISVLQSHPIILAELIY